MLPVRSVGGQIGSAVASRAPSLPPRTPRFDGRLPGPGEAADLSAGAARRRTLEELKTLVRAIEAGVTDPSQLTDLIFYARHPDLLGVPLTGAHQGQLDEWNAISALLVHPTLNEIGDLRGESSLNFVGGGRIPGGAVDRFDEVIARAVAWCPGLPPAALKSLLAQESNFDPTVINEYGYAGIAQFGRDEAREVGLYVGVAGSRSDERLNPSKAIPAAARLLNLKAQRLSELAFSRYGQPDGAEFWKFVLAAYNGGEGTVALAMGHAYRAGLATARAKGLVGPAAVGFARHHASQWRNISLGGTGSPLGQAAARYFPALATEKYYEISNYPAAIIARALSSQT